VVGGIVLAAKRHKSVMEPAAAGANDAAPVRFFGPRGRQKRVFTSKTTSSKARLFRSHMPINGTFPILRVEASKSNELISRRAPDKPARLTQLPLKSGKVQSYHEPDSLPSCNDCV